MNGDLIEELQNRLNRPTEVLANRLCKLHIATAMRGFRFARTYSPCNQGFIKRLAPHSPRSTFIGSRRAARIAGMRNAATEIVPSRTSDDEKLATSNGLT